MVKAKIYKYVSEFEGFPKKSNFELVEEELAPIKDGEYLTQALYLSVDPYMRAFAKRIEKGNTMIGGQVARIIESKHKDFPVGKYIVNRDGWRTHTISNGAPTGRIEPYLLPDIGNLSPSLGLGVLGMPGNTAYFLFLDICQPKAGETVVVTAAGGAVGSIVGQIAKIKGLTVIGIAGTDEKGDWITKELGFDHFINYKKQNVDQELSRLAPKGIDIHFDNVAGETAATILKHMNSKGRIARCGRISSYNDTNTNSTDYITDNLTLIESKQIHVDGFPVAQRTATRWMDGINQIHEWIKQGKIKYRETITNGFENIVDAFIDMLKGGNIGKAIVKV